MKGRFVPIVVAALMFIALAATFAADDDKPATDKPAAEKPATPGARAGGGVRFGDGFGGQGGLGAIGARDTFAELSAALGDVNLTIDFTLTAEQKEKIQVIVR